MARLSHRRGRTHRVPALVVAAGCLAGFAVVAATAAPGWWGPVDAAVGSYFETHGSGAADVGLSVAAVLVGTYATATWTLAVVALMAARPPSRARGAALVAGLAVVSAVEITLKLALHHPGPAWSRGLFRVAGGPSPDTPGSFPSGQMARAALMLGGTVLLARPRRRRLLVAASLALGAAILVSRMYLGDHWASDVAGGLLLGFAGLAAAVAVRKDGGHAQEGRRLAAPL